MESKEHITSNQKMPWSLKPQLHTSLYFATVILIFISVTYGYAGAIASGVGNVHGIFLLLGFSTATFVIGLRVGRSIGNVTLSLLKEKQDDLLRMKGSPLHLIKLPVYDPDERKRMTRSWMVRSVPAVFLYFIIMATGIVHESFDMLYMSPSGLVTYLFGLKISMHVKPLVTWARQLDGT